MKELEGYKVVALDEQGNYRSVTQGIRRGQSGRVFPVGKRVRPKKNCGPFGVFDRLGDAHSFESALYCDQCRIFRCSIEESRHMKVWDQKGNSTEVRWMPFGTRLADSVTLIEQVWPVKEVEG